MYVLQYKKWYVLGGICILLTQLGISYIVENTKQAVNFATGNHGQIPDIIWAILLWACLVFCVRVSSRLLFFIPARNMECNVRRDYFNILLQQDRIFFAKNGSGDVLSRSANDVPSIRAAIGYGIMQFIHVCIALIFGLHGMMAMSKEVTLYVSIPICFGFIIIQWHARYVFQYLRHSSFQSAEISAFCLASFRGVGIIQSYDSVTPILHKFSAINSNYFQTHLQISRSLAIISPITKFMGDFVVALVLFWIGPQVIVGKMSMGEVTAFLGYIAMVMPPMMSLGWTINMFQRSAPSIARVMEILMTPSKPNDTHAFANVTTHNPSKQNAPFISTANKILDTKHLPTQAHVRVCNMFYTYLQQKDRLQPFCLKNISLDILPGKVIAIIGPIGSGKTTLLETILGLNEIPPNSIYLNNVLSENMSKYEYRSYFSWAGQQPFLFSTTLRKNLCTALPYSNIPNLDEILFSILDLVQFNLSPQIFPLGLETLVGEKGIMLSGGQKQRIALARCLLKPASIYILDDVLASVDFATETNILQNLRLWHGTKSMILLSHRLSSIYWADEILVLHDGEIAARGRHEDLLKSSSYYQKIWQYQNTTQEIIYGT